MNWLQLCHDRALADLPYKIELDQYGRIIMSPATKRRSRLQGRILRLLAPLMPPGDALPQCAVETAEGTRVAHVGWVAEARWAAMNPDDASCTIAPETCVQILSPASTLAEMLGRPDKPGKRELYFRAGAGEFWVCDESGRLSFYGSSGPIQKSALCPGFPDQV